MSASHTIELSEEDPAVETHPRFSGRRVVTIKLSPAPNREWMQRFNEWNTFSSGRENPRCEGGSIVFDYVADRERDAEELLRDVRAQLKVTNDWYGQQLAIQRAARQAEEDKAKDAATLNAEAASRLSKMLRGQS